MTFLRRLWFFLTRWRRIDDLDEEMRLHLELRAAANRRRGLTTEEAASEARRRFGSPLRLREQSREAWGFSELERISRDLRDAARQLVRRPLSTFVIVLTLALGVGANTAVFTLVDAMLFKPAAWNQTGRLVWIASVIRGSPRNVSYPDYLAYRNRATTFSGLLASGGNAVAIGGPHPTRALAGLVSGNYFAVLGIRPALGRTLTPGDDAEPGARPVVVLSDAFWRSHFGADRGVIDRRIAINGHPFTIVGVAPPGFIGVAYADNAEQLWMPLAMQTVAMPTAPGLLAAENTGWLRVVGRLRDGVNAQQADAEIHVLARQLTPATAPRDRVKSARVIPMRGGMTPWEQDSFAPVFGLVSIVPIFVLLVACANVANVLLARDLARRKELALRRALGASRRRLIRRLLTESLLLALLSAAAGFALSFGLMALIERIGDVPADFSALLTPGGRAFMAATAVAILTILGFGLAPALTATKFDVLPALKEDGSTSTSAGGRARLQKIFVVAQMALSLALLIVAGLFLRSLVNVLRVDPGFDPDGVVTVSFDPSLQGYTTSQRNAFVARYLERASSLPGVLSAAATTALPLSDDVRGSAVIAAPSTTAVHASRAGVSPRYFQTLQMSLLRGRDFAATDTPEAPPVAIVNKALARLLWAGESPLGKRIRIADSKGEPWREVVGVVSNTKIDSLTETPRAAYYIPATQQSGARISLLVRTAGHEQAALSSLTEIARDLDPDLPLFNVQTLEELVHQSLHLRRAVVSLLGVFGLLTLLLAAIGIYGIAAHRAALRTREVGIRMSLGARAGDMSRLFVGESLSLALVGVLVGLGISAAASKLLTAYLFGLTSIDAATFVIGSLALCLVAVVASYIPARRAARIEPLVALRHE